MTFGKSRLVSAGIDVPSIQRWRRPGAGTIARAGWYWSRPKIVGRSVAAAERYVFPSRVSIPFRRSKRVRVSGAPNSPGRFRFIRRY